MRVVPNRPLLLTLAACAVVGVAAPPSSAHDAPMPNGARHGLLPDEPWVMAHWLPFDERVLTDALRLRPAQLEAFLYNDHHTIAQLARQRRIGVTGLVRRLSAWADTVPGADRVEIERRTRLVLVGGHLAQHLMFHVYHGADLVPPVVRTAGISWDRFDAERSRRWSLRRVVSASGKDPVAVEKSVATMIDETRDKGVAGFETPQSEGVRLAARQQGRLHCWFTRPAQALDPAAPYDRGYTKHAASHTSRDVPRTRAEQRVEDQMISRALAGRPKACWDLPQQFRSDPGAPLSRKRLRVLGGVPNGFKGKVNDGDHGRGHEMHDM